MRKFVILLLCLALTVPLFSQTARPGRNPRWDRQVDWILNGQETLTYKTLTSPTLTSPTISGTVTNTATNNFGGNATFTHDSDTLKINLGTAAYPIDLEVGNTRIFAVDSGGTPYFLAGTYTTTTSLTVLADGDSVQLSPYHKLNILDIEDDNTDIFTVDSTGLVGLKGGAVIDNVTSATILNLSETTVKASGIFVSTIAETGDDEAITFDLGTDLHLVDITTGSTSLFNIDSTGIVNMKNGASLDNITAAGILNLTETQVKVTGQLVTTDYADLADSARIGAGTWIRKIGKTAYGDSLYIVVHASLATSDTVWLPLN